MSDPDESEDRVGGARRNRNELVVVAAAVPCDAGFEHVNDASGTS